LDVYRRRGRYADGALARATATATAIAASVLIITTSAPSACDAGEGGAGGDDEGRGGDGGGRGSRASQSAISVATAPAIDVVEISPIPSPQPRPVTAGASLTGRSLLSGPCFGGRPSTSSPSFTNGSPRTLATSDVPSQRASPETAFSLHWQSSMKESPPRSRPESRQNRFRA